jgi:hypothetical protein
MVECCFVNACLQLAQGYVSQVSSS